MEDDGLERYIRILHGKINPKAKPSTNKLGDSFPSLMVVTIISSIVITIVLVGLAISRYSNRRKKQVNDSSYSVTRYCRRQFPSTSCESFTPKQSNKINNETTHIIKNSFSWPETNLSQQVESSTISSSSSSNNSSMMENLIEPASLTFSLRWDEINQSLFVRVINARDLFIHKHHQQPLIIDSYVRIELLQENSPSKTLPSMRTHIIKKNPHPIYDELFEFPNLEEIKQENSSLIFTISTYDTFTRDEIVGEVIFPIQSSTLDSTEMIFTQNLTPRHKQLNNQELGQMLISMCYQPDDSTLTIIVLKASNLPRIGNTRLINPYFKIYMFYKQQRIIKKRSTIKRTTQSPVYNESFTFHIPDNDIENIYFDLILFDYDRHMKHEAIGMYSIGKELNQHWDDVCHRQRTKQIAHWYQFKPFNGTTS